MSLISLSQSSWARVWSKEDVHGTRDPQVFYCPNPTSSDPVEVCLTPDEARATAKMLNRHANFLKPLPRVTKKKRRA